MAIDAESWPLDAESWPLDADWSLATPTRRCVRFPELGCRPPSKQTQYGMINVTHVITQNHKNFFLRVFDVEWNGEKRQLKQFAYTSWPDHGVPMTSSELLGFRNAVRNSRTNREIPLLVHCSAGVGRTGTYIAIDRVW